jgi:hypothetical protein
VRSGSRGTRADQGVYEGRQSPAVDRGLRRGEIFA